MIITDIIRKYEISYLNNLRSWLIETCTVNTCCLIVTNDIIITTF